MRLRMLVPLIALLPLAVAGPADAEAGSTGGCAVKGSKTARATKKVRVYRSDGHLYGCVRKTGLTRPLSPKRYGLPAGNEYGSEGQVRVAGYHVAWVSSSICTACGDAGPEATLHVIELRSGERRQLDPVRGQPPYPYSGGVRIDALVLDRCGRIAYRATLAHVYRDDQEPDPQLHTWVPGKHRRVDRGAISRRSIRLRPESVHWRRDGESRSAALSPAC